MVFKLVTKWTKQVSKVREMVRKREKYVKMIPKRYL